MYDRRCCRGRWRWCRCRRWCRGRRGVGGGGRDGRGVWWRVLLRCSKRWCSCPGRRGAEVEVGAGISPLYRGSRDVRGLWRSRVRSLLSLLLLLLQRLRRHRCSSCRRCTVRTVVHRWFQCAALAAGGVFVVGARREPLPSVLTAFSFTTALIRRMRIVNAAAAGCGALTRIRSASVAGVTRRLVGSTS